MTTTTPTRSVGTDDPADHDRVLPEPDWELDRLDLDAYLARIGHHGPRTPTRDTLDAVYCAHQRSVPFENVTALTGDHVPLDLDALQAKMVDRRRGGYCFEHVLLFGAALTRLGFDVTRLAARVRPNAPQPLPRTHQLLLTRVDDEPMVCDIGFGAGVLAPLPLADGVTRQGDWEYRVQRHDDGWLLSERGAGDWSDLHLFTEQPQLPSDVEMANHFTATSSHSPFSHRLLAMHVDERARHTLVDRTLTVERPDGAHHERQLSTDEALTALAGTFNVHLDDAEQAAVRAHLETVRT
ncbi:arylamine N-acetyltransferase [soil metagenome]